MKRRIVSIMLSLVLGSALLAGCGGSSAGSQSAPTEAPAEAAEEVAEETAEAAEEAVEAAEETAEAVEETTEAAEETAGEAVEEDAAETAEAIDAGEGEVLDTSFGETVAAFMAEHGRPVGDIIIDLNVNDAEELSEEEGAELDRAMRAYVPGVDSLLVNNAPAFYYYDQLTADQQILYDAMYMMTEDPTDENNIATFNLVSEPDDNFFVDYLAPAYYSLLYDHPELFWLYNGIETDLEFGYIAQGGEYILYIRYEDTYDDYEEDMKAFNKAAEDFLADIDLTASQADIAKAIHDKLISSVVYDNEVMEQGIGQDFAHTAYGALVANSRGDKNTCVCDGYSQAFIYLCQQAGIEGVYMCGIAGDENSKGGHAWSLVNVDGNWQEVDSCWDDYNDLFEAFAAEYGSGTDEVSVKIMKAVNDKAYVDKVQHYLYCVPTSYITNFTDSEKFWYYYDDETALPLVNNSEHVRMNDAGTINEYGYDAVLMGEAPVAG